ncbi:hypothetical protein [Caldanaerobius fijiensis]|nr:hypothetical protein [Caldanaerobius fijiensis]
MKPKGEDDNGADIQAYGDERKVCLKLRYVLPAKVGNDGNQA